MEEEKKEYFSAYKEEESCKLLFDSLFCGAMKQPCIQVLLKCI